MEIQGRSFLVTGGGSGLGLACVELLVAQGGQVVIVDLSRSAAEATVGKLGARASFIEADVCDEAKVREAVVTANSRAPLGGVVCCAGIAPAARLVGRDGPHDFALFEKVIRVNLLGTFNVLRLAAAEMSGNDPTADGERGVVICTASVAAFDGQIGQAAYAASKGGVAAMTLPAARELAKFGIRVVTIAPGIFATPMVAGMSAEVQESLAAQIPFPKRLGQPEEFAALVRHVIVNPMLNGETIRLDGAVRMGPK
ncbi:MAG: SDR family NAD(P)-dependent oxidoreductase [Planctomycetales bacterium]|nr:SDR family NAD(P)-dependent oxidoreductase [Planctomycetales bacterium]MBN8625174.1 SDR family NAD(P)-dependent oxidoreductase [Planctomycetota bacterium]